MRRLYSTFAGGWPAIGLLLMRLVVGAVVLWHAGPRLWSDPPLHIILAYASLALAGLLLIAGLWTPRRWSGGRRCRRSPRSSRLANLRLGASRSNHRGRSGDARTRPVGRSTLGSSDGSASTHHCAEVVRTRAEPGTPHPKGSLTPPCQVVSSHPRSRPKPSPSRRNTPSQSSRSTLFEPTNAPERRLWPPARTPRIAEDREGYRDAGY